MTIDLAALCENHPDAPEEVLQPYMHKAAIALQRRHAPGVRLSIQHGGTQVDDELMWLVKPKRDADFLDAVRVTEDGAEAIALAVVHRLYGWTVIRRVQRGAYADWLLAQDGSDSRIALDVGGTDKGDDAQILREKLDQVSRCYLARQRVACAVRFLEPRCKVSACAS